MAYVRRPGLSPDDVMQRTERWTALGKLPATRQPMRIVDYLWDLVKWNEESLIEDYANLKVASSPNRPGRITPLMTSTSGSAKTPRSSRGCPRRSKGPVMIDRNAHHRRWRCLEGPCYIPPSPRSCPTRSFAPAPPSAPCAKWPAKSPTRSFLAIPTRPTTAIWATATSQWVNLGAGTTTSNLKNTYGEIVARGGDGDVKTGRRFLGALIGDHAKLASAPA